MSIDEIHNLIYFYLRKSQNGFVSHAEIDRVLNRESFNLMAQLKPAYGSSQMLHDFLYPFKRQYTYTNSSSPAGLITMPADYQFLLLIEATVNDSAGNHSIEVDLVGEGHIAARKNSQLIPLNAYNQFVVDLPGPQFQLYPQQAGAGTIYYLKRPVYCQWVAQVGTSGRTAAYDSVNSVQLEWNDPAIDKIIMMSLKTLGMNVGDAGLVSISQADTAQGGPK